MMEMPNTVVVELSEETIKRLGEVIAQKITFAKNAPEPWITIEELSEKIGRGKGSLYKDVERSDIPHLRSGRKLRFRVTEVERWLRDRQ